MCWPLAWLMYIITSAIQVLTKALKLFILLIFVSDFLQIFSQLVANCIHSNYQVSWKYNAYNPVPQRPGKTWRSRERHGFSKPHHLKALRLRCCSMRQSYKPCRVPPPTLGAPSQLCRSHVTWPNSVLAGPGYNCNCIGLMPASSQYFETPQATITACKHFLWPESAALLQWCVGSSEYFSPGLGPFHLKLVLGLADLALSSTVQFIFHFLIMFQTVEMGSLKWFSFSVEINIISTSTWLSWTTHLKCADCANGQGSYQGQS